MSILNVGGKITFGYLPNDESVMVNSSSGIVSSSTGVTNEQLSDDLQTSIAQIAINTTNIASNTADIGTNTSNIATNTTNIATNATNIATNTTNIATNTTNIATNTTNIATNTTNIASNTSSINTINSEIEALQASGVSLDSVAPMVFDANTYSFPNFGMSWQTAAGSATVGMTTNICCSGDGKIVFLCTPSPNPPRISRDYGKTWSNVTSLNNDAPMCALNYDGSVIVASSNGILKISTDVGQTFSSVSSITNVQSIALSATGKVILCGSTNSLNISTDYGSSWTTIDSTSSWSSVAVSMDGSVSYAAINNGKLYKYLNDSLLMCYDFTVQLRRLCCSADGQRVMAIITGAAASIKLSTDSGNTFNNVGTEQTYITCAMSSNGLYMIAATNTGVLFVSSNYGNSWSSLNNSYLFVAMSYDGSMLFNVGSPSDVIISDAHNNTSVIVSDVAPLNPNAGLMYFNTSTSTLNLFVNGSWNVIYTYLT